jgi:hypothetical protein
MRIDPLSTLLFYIPAISVLQYITVYALLKQISEICLLWNMHTSKIIPSVLWYIMQ